MTLPAALLEWDLLHTPGKTTAQVCTAGPLDFVEAFLQLAPA